MNSCSIFLCLEKPLLTPNETIVFVGNTVVFTCTISGEDVFFSWTTKPETDLEYHPKGSFNSTSGNTTTHLELEVNSTYYNQMEVTCHVLFSNGDSVKSDVSLISVQGSYIPLNYEFYNKILFHICRSTKQSDK